MLKILIPLILILSGCTSTKGYSGPELPADQVANIHFSSDGRMKVQEIFIDGNKIVVPTLSFDYPAGSHKFSITYNYDKTAHCTDINKCTAKVVQGKCDGTILTKGGLDYVVSMLNRDDVVSGKVQARGFFSLSTRPDEPNPGKIVCK